MTKSISPENYDPQRMGSPATDPSRWKEFIQTFEQSPFPTQENHNDEYHLEERLYRIDGYEMM